MAKYKFLNVNPDKQKEFDCVTRAISFCSGLPYNIVRKKLFHTSRLLDCDKLCVCCYKFFIEKVLNCKPIKCYGMTVNEFADLHPLGTYLVRMDGHISSVKNNCVYDIFDCRDLELTDAWKI